MSLIKFLLLTTCLLFINGKSVVAQPIPNTKVDVCVYGATSAGIIAAYTAKMQGKTVLLIEPGRHLGGLSSGGLGYTDIGNKYVITGLARDFYRRIGAHYGKFEQWIFEPKVAENIFRGYVERARIAPLFEYRLNQVQKDGNRISEIVIEPSIKSGPLMSVKAKMFIDCTYEGDLMAASGVSYTVGREDNALYNETFNGVQQLKGHQFPDGIDPYVIKGNPQSGLLWGITNNQLQPKGTGDAKVQAYNFRVTLTNVDSNKVPITKPNNYDAARYELLIRLKEKMPWKSLEDVFIWSKMPNGKTDINNKGGFSTDMIAANWNYPNASFEQRTKFIRELEDYTKGLFYFIGNDQRIPEHIRNDMRVWGYPKDEFQDNGNFSHQPYVREARRMISELVMNENHCRRKDVVTDGVGMAAYNMDSHNCDRLVVNGVVKNEGNVEIGGISPYPISYRSIVPRESQASNLLVPVCLSASHIAYGSIRMEPVFMVLSQSAAMAACMAIDKNVSVQKVDIVALQNVLKRNPLADNSLAEILVDNDDFDNVKISGRWSVHNSEGYGSSFLYGNADSTDLKVRFTPIIQKKGVYAVYSYSPKVNSEGFHNTCKISDGKAISVKRIASDDVKVEGQTMGEWAFLGNYLFPKGSKAFVEIHPGSARSGVVADAILFVPQKNTRL